MLLYTKFLYTSFEIGVEGSPDFQVQIKPPEKEMAYRFEYLENINTKRLMSSHKRQGSLPVNITITPPENSTGTPQRRKPSMLQRRMTFNLTPVTLDYLKVKFQLVATLMSIICSDEMDDIEYQMEEDYFEDPEDQDFYQKASTESGQLDIRSYRYRSIKENYPVLGSHLLDHVIPLLEAKDPEFGKSPDIILKAMTSSLDLDTRSCVLSLPQSNTYQQTLKEIFISLWHSEKYVDILNLMNHIPAENMLHTCDWLKLKDHVAFQYVTSDSYNIDLYDMKKYLLDISDPVTQANAIFGSLVKLDVDLCLYLLKYSVRRPDVTGPLKEAIKEKLAKVETYQRVGGKSVLSHCYNKKTYKIVS